MNINHRLTLILAATALIAGCGKDSSLSENSDNEIKYKVGFASITTKSSETAMDGSEFLLSNATGTAAIPVTGEVSGWFSDGRGVATKGQLVNATGSDDTPQNYGIDTFKASAYDVETPIYREEEVTYSSSTSKWSTEDTYYWPAETSLDFYAYANLPDESAYTSVTIAETGVTLSGYNVPGTASEQTDILLGSYHGYGSGSGTAEIRFEHPLTAVRFLYGNIEGNPGIKSISLEGVAASGTVAMDAEELIEWSGVSDFDHTVSQTDESGLGLSDLTGHTAKLIGEPFIIIPQDLEENNVTVTVTFDDDTVIEAMLSAGTWQAGKTNTYTLGYSVTDPDLLPGIFSVSPTEKVKFAKGNLFCKRDGSAGSYTYEFSMEKHQYDYRTRPKSMVASLISGPCVIDGIPGTTPDNMSGFFLWDIYDRAGYGAFETALTSGATSGSDVLDFGQVFGSDSNWTTLTKSEFEYLTDGGLSGSARPNAQNLIKKTTIHLPDVDVPGYVIAPDNFTGTLAAEYTLSDWETAEATSSLVFLPWIGSASGNSISSSGIFYWSQTASETNDYYAYCLKQNVDVPAVSGTSRAYGFPVRLVQKFDKPIEYVEIGGLKWATCNIGASSPKDYGWYFFWGGTEGYEYDSTNKKWVKASDHTTELSGGFCFNNTPYQTENTTNFAFAKFTKYLGSTTSEFKDPSATDADALKTVLDPEDDAAQVNWGGEWRMPTGEDFRALYEACGGTEDVMRPLSALSSSNPDQGIYRVSKEQTHISEYTGVAGLLFCDGEGHKLFFPVTGLGNDAGLHYAASSGYYWSSSLFSDTPSIAYYLSFNSYDVYPPFSGCDRSLGFPVRPVHD